MAFYIIFILQYTPVYLDVCKHFEDEDHATCQKKVDLTCKLIDYEFCTDRAIDAAKNCDDFRTAAAYLSQKCDSCNKEFSLPEVRWQFHLVFRIHWL